MALGSAEFLRQYLAERDVACPQCEYNLRNLQTGICPECGERLELRLALVDPRQGSWLTALIGLSAGAGFDALLLLYIAIMELRGIRGPTGRQFWLFTGITGIGLLMLGMLMIYLLLARRRFRAQAGWVQWTVAGGCWLLSIINLVIFSFAVR